MKPIRTLSTLTTVAAVLFTGGLADGNTYRSQGEFSTAENWNAWQSWEILDGGSYRNMTSSDPLPQAGDTVVVRSPDLIQVTDARGVMSLTIDSGGKLEITGGSPAKLTIAGASPVLAVNAADGVLVGNGILEFGATIIPSGTGSLKGNHASAVIQIAPGGGTVTLTTGVEFHGQFSVQKDGSGTANFTNNSLVRTNGGTIQLASSLGTVLDGSTDNALRWKAGLSGDILQFGVAASGLNGQFYAVIGGTLRFNANVTTAGNLVMECDTSTVEVNSAQFDFDTFSGSCSGPPSPGIITANFSCSGCS